MARFLSTVFLAALAPVLVAFLVANRVPVRISFDPFSLDDPALAFDMPLWAGLSGTMVVGVILGALGMWISTSRLRTRANERRAEIAKLERELQMARSRPAPAAGPEDRVPERVRLAAPQT
jgi:hypothetical protein